MTEQFFYTFSQTDEFEEIKNAVERFIRYRFIQDSGFQEKAKNTNEKTILLGGWIDDGAIEKAFEKCTQVAKDEKAVIFVTTERYETEDGLWEGEKYKIKNLNLSRIFAEFLNAPMISLQDSDWSEKLEYYLGSDISSERSKIGSLIQVLEKVGNSYPGGKRDSTRLLTDTLEHLATDKHARRAQREHDLQKEAGARLDYGNLLEIRKKQFFDAIVDCVDAMRHPKPLACIIGNKNSEEQTPRLPDKKFNVVIFDNNLDERESDILKLLTELFPMMQFYWTKGMDFHQLIDNLRQSALEGFKNKSTCVKGVSKNFLLKNINDSNPEISNWNDIDLILQDLYLDPEQPTGHEMVSAFAKYAPEIPVFVFSSSPSIEDTHKAFRCGADKYVWKFQTLALPKRILDFFKNTGTLITRISDSDMRRNLIGNIRHWKQHREYLWFGDKCYHMINHSFNHVENDWRIAHKVLIPILDHFGEDYFSDEDLYCLFMAVWLHDIGHKGNERYGEPHEIRDLHGLISAELILKFPEHYGIYGCNVQDSSPYRWLSFRHPRTAPQIIRERIASLEAAGRVLEQSKKDSEKNEQKEPGAVQPELKVEQQYIQKLTILEKIALLCIYHKSNFPMDEKDLKNIVRKRKRIPRDCYENFDRGTSPIHLKSFSDLMGDHNLLQLMALFRFIDGLDINENRVGDETEEGVKKETIKRDLNYQLFKLENDVRQLADTHLRNTEKERRFISLFYDQVEQNIQEQQWISDDLKKEQRRFLDTLQVDVPLDNYYMLTEYIEFISVQEGHFDLHNSIHELEIKDVLQGNGKLRFHITYKSQKDKNYLENKVVKERGEKEGKNIPNHLLGESEEGKEYREKDSDGYVRRELNSVKEYLKDWFDLKNTKIYLHGSDKLYEELPLKD